MKQILRLILWVSVPYSMSQNDTPYFLYMGEDPSDRCLQTPGVLYFLKLQHIHMDPVLLFLFYLCYKLSSYPTDRTRCFQHIKFHWSQYDVNSRPARLTWESTEERKPSEQKVGSAYVGNECTKEVKGIQSLLNPVVLDRQDGPPSPICNRTV